MAALNRQAAAGIAAQTLGRKPLVAGDMLNQDKGESFLKSVDINRNMLRDSGGRNKDDTATTTEKYPMQWGYQVLPTLYSVYQKVHSSLLDSHAYWRFFFSSVVFLFQECFDLSACEIMFL